MDPPASGSEWIALSSAPLPVAAASEWIVIPGCGGNVVFTGTVRDNADGRSGVEWLEYEAYEEQAVAKMEGVAAAARHKWPGLGRVALLHRTGKLDVSEAAVVVAVSAPHRGDAFDAARFCIDTLKAEVPIWKKERWADGEDWGFSEAQGAVDSEGRVGSASEQRPAERSLQARPSEGRVGSASEQRPAERSLQARPSEERVGSASEQRPAERSLQARPSV